MQTQFQARISRIGFRSYSLGRQNFQERQNFFEIFLSCFAQAFCSNHCRITCLSVFPVSVHFGDCEVRRLQARSQGG